MSILGEGKAVTALFAIILPDGSRVRLSDFRVKRDEDNDVVHWILVHKGREYLIFND